MDGIKPLYKGFQAVIFVLVGILFITDHCLGKPCLLFYINMFVVFWNDDVVPTFKERMKIGHECVRLARGLGFGRRGYGRPMRSRRSMGGPSDGL